MNVVNEMGVIVEFSKVCEVLDWEVVEIQSSFPDAILRNRKTNELLRAEFEYNSANFSAHDHNPEECDIIICWINDWKNCPLPVWELSNPQWMVEAYTRNNRIDHKEKKIMDFLASLVSYWRREARGEVDDRDYSRQFSCLNAGAGCDRVFASRNAANAHARSCPFKPTISMPVEEKAKAKQ